MAETPKPAALEHQERLTLAIQMRKDYATWQAVADECGYADRATAYNAVNREMQRRAAELTEGVDELRAQELERLDDLAARALDVMGADHYALSGGKIVNGPDGFPLSDHGPVLAAASTLVKISESRRRLLGLDAPQRVEAAVAVTFTVQGIPEEQLP